jgi:hypothetical protein
MVDYDYFLICPVRGVDESTLVALRTFVALTEAKGRRVYWPYRDTNQVDAVGVRICHDNREAMRRSAEVAVWWTPTSQGSLFDLGMAWAMGKPISLANDVPATEGKSFGNVLRWWQEKGPNPA